LAQKTNISDAERSARYLPDLEFWDFIVFLKLKIESHFELLEDIQNNFYQAWHRHGMDVQSQKTSALKVTTITKC
jgi:hypothetical protein